mgnify:CR=1 FL=1
MQYRQSAFLVNHLVALGHYPEIVENLDPGTVSLLFDDRSENTGQSLRAELERRVDGRVEILGVQEASRGGRRWNLGVSIVSFDRVLCRKLFRTWVKLEHGVYDVGGSSFSDKNLLYDAVLCHGPYSSERLERVYGVKTYQVGYPKYSTAVEQNLSPQSAVRSALGVREDQLLVSWLPTLDEKNSINAFVDEFSALPENIFAVAKLHPMTASLHPDQARGIEVSGVRLLPENVNFELQDLILGSDVTVHDLGGTGLAAIYLWANPIFLEISDSASTANGERTPESMVRSILGAVVPGNLSFAIAESLKVSRPDSPESIMRAGLRRKFFAGEKGLDSLIAARTISRLAARSWLLAWADSNPVSRLVRRLAITRLRKNSVRKLFSQSSVKGGGQ